MAHRKSGKPKNNSPNESVPSSAETNTLNTINSSRIDTENQAISHRIDLLHDLFNKRFDDQNAQIKQLQEKVQHLENEVEQYKVQVKTLENKITNLQHKHTEQKQEEANNDSIVPTGEDSTSNISIQVTSGNEANSEITQNIQKQSKTIVQSVDHKVPVSCSANTTTQPVDNNFAKWMCSQSWRESLWSNDKYKCFLLQYLSKIYHQKDRVHSIFDQVQRSMPKSDELDILYALVKQLEQQIGAARSLHNWEINARPSKHVEELKSILKYNSGCGSSTKQWKVSPQIPNKEKFINCESIKTYFDLICRDGSTTFKIGEYFGLTKENILGGDNYDAHNDKITHVYVDSNKSTIALDKNRVDLITCLVTLHHVSDLNSMLREFVRILRPGGYVIIREHDCEATRSHQVKYLNFIHAIMRIAKIGEYSTTCTHSTNSTQDGANNSTTTTIDWKQEKLDVIEDAKSIQYRTHDGWCEEMKRVGLRHKATFRYDSNEFHPMAHFYAVYQLQDK